MKRHKVACPRWLLGLDGIHNSLVRIHDFLNLRDRRPAAQADANGGFESAAQSQAENLEERVSGSIPDQLVKTDIDAGKTVQVMQRFPHPFDRLPQCIDVPLIPMSRCQFRGVDLDREAEFQDVFDGHLLCRKGMKEKRRERIMAQLAHSRGTAHGDLEYPCRSQRVIGLANHATTDPQFTAYLYLRGDSVSWFEIVVVDVLDQVLRHPFREVVTVAGSGFHAPSLP